MRRYIIASHHLLAHGLKDTLNFLTSMDGIIDISAYMDDHRSSYPDQRII